MEAFINAGSVMVVLFIVVALGYFARKIRMIDQNFNDSLSKVVMNITCPAVVLDSVLSNDNLPSNEVIWQILGVSFLIFIPVILVSLVIPRFYKIPKTQRGGHSFSICFSNVGLIGFAVCDSILGSESVLYIAIYNIACNLVLYSVGAWMISSTGSVKLSIKEQLVYIRKNLISPVMACCVIALFLALFRVTDSGIVGFTCELLGGMTAPAAMLVVGSTLATYKIKDMVTNGWAYVSTFSRLIVTPAVVFLVGGLLIADPYQLASLTLVCATPAAMMGITMGILYGGDLDSLSQCMFLTTIFSIVTIPLVTMFIT